MQSHTGNQSDIADSLIFSVLFNVWHSIELWLKSGIGALSILNNRENPPNLNHDIFKLRDAFKKELINLGMKETIEISMKDVDNLIEEFQRVNAHFDFARYSFKSKGGYQFYNAPYTDEKHWQSNNKDPHANKHHVPNTCVDIPALVELINNIIKNFRELIYYLTMCIISSSKASDAGFDLFIKIDDSLFNDNNNDKSETDPIERIMDIICENIV